MANPSTTALATPAGKVLRQGKRCALVFSRLPTASFWEKATKPAGADSGEPIDTTTMRNVLFTTKAPGELINFTNATARCAYDPNLLNQIVNTLIKQEGSMTVHMPDGTTVDYWAYLKSIEPVEVAIGAQPEANLDIVITNWDPTNSVEAGPVVTSVAGT